MAVPRLRWRAEQLAQEQDGRSSSEDLTRLSREGMLKLVHELRVHQIELKMQNDELCRAQAELNATRERYFDLYNLAPVGYFIVSHEGRILESNLAGVTLLGVPRAALVKQPIVRFILTEDQDVYYHHRRQLLATGRAHTCELRMVKRGGTPFWVRLTASLAPPATTAELGTGGTPVTHVVLSDISEQKLLAARQAKQKVRHPRRKKRPAVGRKAATGRRRKNARTSRRLRHGAQ
jgi:PAS domain S-box-containing protein